MTKYSSVRDHLKAFQEIIPKNARSSFLHKLAEGFVSDCMEKSLTYKDILVLIVAFCDCETADLQVQEQRQRRSLLELLSDLEKITDERERGAFLQDLGQGLRAAARKQSITDTEALEFFGYVLGCLNTCLRHEPKKQSGD